jgi:PrtD family type I secretion system ABC transporter
MFSSGVFRAIHLDYRSEAARTLGACRQGFIAAGLFSGAINGLMLTGAFFMLQVYDRVLPSRSIPTLVALASLAAALFGLMFVLELVRNRIMVRIGRYFETTLGPRAYSATLEAARLSPHRTNGASSIRDVEQVRSFIASGGPSALFDLPWMALYIAICFSFHIWLGLAVLAGALILICITIASEFLLRFPMRQLSLEQSARGELADAGRRSTGAVHAMGMLGNLRDRWDGTNARFAEAQQRASDISNTLSGISKIFRMMLQSGVLALGAVLVIQQEASAGIIIASSIVASRALAPIEVVVGQWKNFVSMRESWSRLKAPLFAPGCEDRMELPPPKRYVSIEKLAVVPPGAAAPSVQDVSLKLAAGTAIGIIGPSASGKSSLARAIVGVWPAERGYVRLDDATLDQWDAHELGRHIGYVPQDVELLPGAVARNISRFDPAATPEAIVAAAQAAGAHEMIVRLPRGYETEVGQNGAALSAGQRQRIALARALYGNPFLVVLDEPNSNLDAEGDAALTRAIADARARGAIVLVVAHRPSALAGVDQVLVLGSGRVQAFGPKDEVLRGMFRAAAPTTAQLKPAA